MIPCVHGVGASLQAMVAAFSDMGKDNRSIEPQDVVQLFAEMNTTCTLDDANEIIELLGRYTPNGQVPRPSSGSET